MHDKQREASRWLRQAENDLEFGRVAIREAYFAQACFIAQQAAEKATKAIAYSLGDRVVLGHSVVELVNLVAGRVPEVTELRSAAGTLDQYYVPTRYPNGLPGGVPFEAFSQEQATSAIEAAQRFAALARSWISVGEDE